MKIKGKVNREVARKVYRTAEYDDYFIVLDKDGYIGIEHDGVGYLSDDVEEMCTVFPKTLVDYLIYLASEVKTCYVCGRPLEYGDRAICKHCEAKGKKEPEYNSGWYELANAVCIQAIRDYDQALDAYADDPLSKVARDRALNIELWIAGGEWDLYARGAVEGRAAIESRQKAAKQRWKERQKAKADKLLREKCAFYFEEMKNLEKENERLKKELSKYENSARKRKSK